jgi:alpha-galactosidase
VVYAHSKRLLAGIKPVADYVHSRNMSFGIYTARGSSTCMGRPGSDGHEALDARTFASWGVDYLKEVSARALHPAQHALIHAATTTVRTLLCNPCRRTHAEGRRTERCGSSTHA